MNALDIIKDNLNDTLPVPVETLAYLLLYLESQDAVWVYNDIVEAFVRRAEFGDADARAQLARLIFWPDFWRDH